MRFRAFSALIAMVLQQRSIINRQLQKAKYYIIITITCISPAEFLLLNIAAARQHLTHINGITQKTCRTNTLVWR